MRTTVKITNAPLPLYVKKGGAVDLTADDLTFDVMVNILI